jgi:hypothetical protein
VRGVGVRGVGVRGVGVRGVGVRGVGVRGVGVRAVGVRAVGVRGVGVRGVGVRGVCVQWVSIGMRRIKEKMRRFAALNINPIPQTKSSSTDLFLARMMLSKGNGPCACAYTYVQCMPLFDSPTVLPEATLSVIARIASELTEVSQHQSTSSVHAGRNIFNVAAKGGERRDARSSWRNATSSAQSQYRRASGSDGNHGGRQQRQPQPRNGSTSVGVARFASGVAAQRTSGSSSESVGSSSSGGGDLAGGEWRGSVKKLTTTTSKQINLILNSVVETNAPLIAERIQALLQTAENGDDVFASMATQLVVNALAQSLFSECYVAIVCTLTSRLPSTALWPLVIGKCQHTLTKIVSCEEAVSKHEVKGLGPFLAHMHLAKALDDGALVAIMRTVTVALTKSDVSQSMREICCEILVSTLQRIIQKTATGKRKSGYPEAVKAFIRTELSSVWDDTSMPMRIRIRLLDIKDIY